jgi:uncharacterized protein
MKIVSFFNMKSIRQLFVVLILIFTSWNAFAVELDSAKADGLVGERADGYLGAVKPNPSAAVEALIEDINSKRKQAYQRIAERNNIPLQDVELLAGKKAIEKTAAGGWVFVENWQRK